MCSAYIDISGGGVCTMCCANSGSWRYVASEPVRTIARPSIEWWPWVDASRIDSPVLRTSPPANDRRVGRANRVAVVAHARADAARARAPVAEVDRDGTGDVTRLNECRPGHGPAAHRDRHVVAVADAELLRGRRRHQHGVVPRELRQRLGQFLQPAVVGEATVVDRRVRRERHLVGAADGGRRGRHGRGAHGFRSRRGAGNHAVVNGLAPGLLEHVAGKRGLRLPVLAHQVVAVALGPVAEDGDDLVERLAAIERRDERLHDRGGAVVRARVAPLFEEVRAVDVPVALRRRLVVEQPDVHARLRLAQGVAELEVGRRIEDGVAAEDHQQAHRAGVEILDQRS